MKETKGLTLVDVKENTVYLMIRVKCRFTDGYHVCTSDDVRGLYVSGKNPKQVYDGVGGVLRELVSRQTGAECQVRSALTFNEWLGRSSAARSQQTLQSRDFVVLCDDTPQAAYA